MKSKSEQVPKINIYYSRKVMKAYHNEEVSLERWVSINDEVRKNGLHVCGPNNSDVSYGIAGPVFVEDL